MLRKTMSIITVISLFSTMLLPVTVMAEEAKSEELNKKETTVLPENKIDMEISDEKLKNNEQIPSGEINITDNSDGISKTEVTEQEQDVVDSAQKKEKKNNFDETENSKQITNLSDWEMTDQGSNYLLTKYVGASTEVVVPNEINGKPVVLERINNKVFPNAANITHFTISSENNKKIQIAKSIDGVALFDSKTWQSLESIDMSGLDTSKLRNAVGMFSNSLAKSINLAGWDTSNVINMSYMFQNSKNLIDLDISSFDTSNVIDMNSMFDSCLRLTSLDLKHFDTSEVTNMQMMFRNLPDIESIDVSSFDTSKVTNMQLMFASSPKLSELDLKNFSGNSLTQLNYMFQSTPNLKFIDLRNLDASKITRATRVFDVATETELVVISNSDFFKKYNYKSDSRVGLSTPLFDANGGTFSDGLTQKSYLDNRIVFSPTEFDLLNDLSNFEQFKKDNVPVNGNKLFVGWKIIEGNDENVTSVFPELQNAVYQAQWKTRTVSLEVPTTISFGTHKLSKGTNYYLVDTVEGTSLSIIDDRGIGSKWQLTAKLQTPFTNNGKSLSNSLVYKTSTGEETITENAAQVIATHTTSTDSEKTIISDNWTSTQGLMLKLEEGKAYAGEYSGTIEWTLNDTP
ncbi:BspA family leucine-rich repeat surface protein [Enterococcus faecalis]|nr:BspA family leucine-rich repeat surface protein [Enterococcus faecalis]